MKKNNIFKKIFGAIWNFLVIWWTMPLFIIMLITTVIGAIRTGIDVNDSEKLEEYCMKNVLFRFYKKVTI